MAARSALGLLWALLMLAVWQTAPPADADLMALIWAMMEFRGPDPLAVALFNAMGIWPLLMIGLIARDGKPWGLPFGLASMALGAFVLLPGLSLVPRWEGAPGRGWLARWLGHRLLGLATGLGTLGLVGFVAVNGIGTDHAHWTTSNFLWVMHLDFWTLSLAWVVLVRHDMERHGVFTPGGWALASVPLLGGSWWLFTRPAVDAVGATAAD